MLRENCQICNGEISKAIMETTLTQQDIHKYQWNHILIKHWKRVL